MNIAEKLTKARVNAGLSQGQAKRLTEIAVDEIENGLKEATPEDLQKLADCYAINITWLTQDSAADQRQLSRLIAENNSRFAHLPLMEFFSILDVLAMTEGRKSEPSIEEQGKDNGR